MNEIIRVLQKSKSEKESDIKSLQFELNQINNSLDNELYSETRLYDKVLKNNVITIIDMIHKSGLKCAAISNTESLYGDALYKVTDGCYFANITANNGSIEINYNGIDNDGGGKKLHEVVKDLVGHKIVPLCEEKKLDYIK